MHALRSMRRLITGLGFAALIVGLTPGLASALPRLPITGKQPIRLFARAISFINVNRVYCGINNSGEVCVDSAGRGTVQGGYWPRGTGDNYIFNAGLQVAGVVAGTKSAANPWGGDTAGGWFFDGAGGRQETEAITSVYQAFNPTDAANWPADAFVPQGDAVADIYATPLQGLVSASQGDTHFLAWEGNPALSAARVHPLGIVADYRLLAWNYPAGAQDVVFLVGTVYNVTSANAADYAGNRPAIASILYQQGLKFQALNNAAFHITLPVGGYSISPMYIAAAQDNDVGTVNQNYNGGILPFAMGYTYDGPFSNTIAGWTFDPGIFHAPFFAGSGFVGTKYLKGPNGPGKIQLLTTFCNGNCGGTTGHADPANMFVEFRLIAGTPSSTDGQCNVPGIPAQTHFCFMLFGANGADTRMLESSDSLTLAPGQGKTIVVAYIFAPPVAIPGFTPNGTNTDPGNPTWSNSSDSMFKYNGLNRIDSISGFVKYNGPLTDPDGSSHQPLETDFSVIKGSLLDKANVAQAVFNAKFLQEFAPDAPPFFLIPGDKQVTVLWKPSPTETTGDPFFAVVGTPQTLINGQMVPNPLYDPNYRQFDVEGYRVYRGRSDTPSALQLLVQFDYAGTKFKDYTGAVLNGNCAPELGILTDCPVNFPTPTNPVPPGTAATVFQAYNIGPQAGNLPLIFIDQSSGGRVALAGGTTTLAVVQDTVVTGGASGLPPLADTGIPFIFVDKAGAPSCVACGVNNGVTYFYSVTAFDVNSPGHGPTSLESAKVTHQVTPGASGTNYSNAAVTQAGTFGRSGLLTDSIMPTIDSTTGEFSKAFPASNTLKVSLAGFPTQLLSGAGAASVQFDSTTITAFSANNSTTIKDWFTASGVVISVPITVDPTNGVAAVNGTFSALHIDSTRAATFGGGAGFSVGGTFSYVRPGAYYVSLQGRGCANSGLGTPPTPQVNGQCYFFGPRWFSGANENTPNPTTASPVTFLTGNTAASYNDAGALPGVTTIYHPNAYGYFTGSQWRPVDQALGVFVTAADYQLYWGAAGKIDSVIDVTDKEPVPFKTTIGSSWGVLNASAAPPAGSYDGSANLTVADFTCVAPLRTFSVGTTSCPSANYQLANTVVPGPVAFASGDVSNNQTAAAASEAGFGLYIKGRIFLVQLTGGAVPAAGTVWTERDYIGGIWGGNGKDGNNQFGVYRYLLDAALPFTAPGTSVQFSFNVTNQLNAATAADVANVHTVPDPYYVTSAFDFAVNSKDIQFVNVPVGAIIRIYTSSGVLIRVLQNTTTVLSGIVHWDVRNRTNQFVASGVYFYNVESGGVSHTGRMTIVNYASTVQ